MGKVVSVTVGDTITVLDDANVQHRIRLAGIDAPEKGQAFGRYQNGRSPTSSSGAWLLSSGRKLDRYGRTVGTVSINGQDAYVEQLRRGLAWHYKKYQNEQSPEERESYARAEEESRAAKRGLWAEQAPMPLWEWRHRP